MYNLVIVFTIFVWFTFRMFPNQFHRFNRHFSIDNINSFKSIPSFHVKCDKIVPCYLIFLLNNKQYDIIAHICSEHKWRSTVDRFLAFFIQTSNTFYAPHLLQPAPHHMGSALALFMKTDFVIHLHQFKLGIIFKVHHSVPIPPSALGLPLWCCKVQNPHQIGLARYYKMWDVHIMI